MTTAVCDIARRHKALVLFLVFAGNAPMRTIHLLPEYQYLSLQKISGRFSCNSPEEKQLARHVIKTDAVRKQHGSLIRRRVKCPTPYNVNTKNLS